jgi:hypothetical protein
MPRTVLVLRLIYVGSALLSIAASALVTASLFIANRAPQSAKFLGISLVVSAVFAGAGVVLFGIQRQVAAIAAAVSSPADASAPAPAPGAHVRRLVGYLLAAGVFVGLVLGLLTYAVLARIDQGFAVFG